MNRNETMQLLAALKTLDARGFVTIDDATIDVWTAVLNRDPAIPAGAAMQTAFEIAGRPSQPFPAPGDFRALVAEVVCRVPSVDSARKQIERSMKLNYPGMPPKYTPDQIVIDAVREIGGIHVFRVAQSERETVDLWRRFTAKYQDIRAERLEFVDVAAEWESQQSLPTGDDGDIRQLGKGAA